MSWLDNSYRNDVTGMEDLSHPPSGGHLKLSILGIILPLGLIAYSLQIWISGEAYWPANQGSGMTVSGDTALAMSVAYAFLASFSHFRWFWGLLPHYLTFRIGTTISLIGILGSVVTSLVFLFR